MAISFVSSVPSLRSRSFGVGSLETYSLALGLELVVRIGYVSFGMPIGVGRTLNRCYRAYSALFRVVSGVDDSNISLNFAILYGMRVLRESGPWLWLGSEIKCTLGLGLWVGVR